MVGSQPELLAAAMAEVATVLMPRYATTTLRNRANQGTVLWNKRRTVGYVLPHNHHASKNVNLAA